MRKILGILLMVLLLTVGCSGNQTTESKQTQQESQTTSAATVGTITYADIKDKEDVQIIDIRHPDFYLGWDNPKGNGGHIKGAIDFPASWLEYETNPEHIKIEFERRNIDLNKKTVLYDDEKVAFAAQKNQHYVDFFL